MNQEARQSKRSVARNPDDYQPTEYHSIEFKDRGTISIGQSTRESINPSVRGSLTETQTISHTGSKTLVSWEIDYNQLTLEKIIGKGAYGKESVVKQKKLKIPLEFLWNFQFLLLHYNLIGTRSRMAR